ncbi:25S rRNA (adenine645-N1)-methyltransferase [Vermiconidia calcicola]|uniref:25S rRNA (Adenine645-N1)-methyltransferase n=1 Tax=Vermiconidia calcicola TaxID=1690605 RepID=A0ACC3NNQ7_9PEZI|nr:25S rRNA (adenine645-N1)-methyltransferase [Vermiconidia calcicola]
MFAVKGWSVDAGSLKPQTEVFKPAKAQDGEQQKSSKKRKRRQPNEAKQDPNVRADDVGRLWEQHVEGGELSKSQQKREQKRQKLEQMREEKSGPYELPNAMSKPVGERKIEKWEDIVLGTRAEKMGEKKLTKKEKKKLLKAEEQAKKAERPEDQQPQTANGLGDAGPKPEVAKPIPTDKIVPPTEKLTPMQSAMRQKLISARFRHLNQTLYTEPSNKAQDLFTQNPEMFEDYHAGFRQQVSVWPENPLDKFISEIRRRGKLKPPKIAKKRKVNASAKTLPQEAFYGLLPRTHGVCVLADMGCGDARLAQTLKNAGDTTSLNLKVQSYDLHSPSPLVTKADISKLPLKNDSVDVAILCLALMGTNWIAFIEEAHRILHWKGELWVAEIKSRFGRINKLGKPVEHSVGNKKKQAALLKGKEAKQREEQEVNEDEVLQTEVDGVTSNKEETDVSAFVAVLKRRGFILKPPGERSVDLKNKMFVKMEFVKALTPTKGKGVPREQPKEGSRPKIKFIPDDEEEPSTEDEATVLKPCLYKIR